MKKDSRFPNDKTITVMRSDLSTYRTLQSYNLLRTHKWKVVEVQIMQAHKLGVEIML